MRIPNHLPLAFGLTIGFSFAFYGMGALFYEMKFGRPSSTAAIALFTIPIISIVIGILGCLIAVVARFLWQIAGFRVVAVNNFVAASACLVIIGTALGIGIVGAKRQEASTRPAILVNSGLVQEIAAGNDQMIIRPADIVFNTLGNIHTKVEWGGNSSVLYQMPNGLSVQQINGDKRCIVPTEGLDYITRVYAVHRASTDSRSTLALIIDGRATGKRAMLAVISADYKLLYAERLARFWNYFKCPLAIGSSMQLKSEVIVLAGDDERKAYSVLR